MVKEIKLSLLIILGFLFLGLTTVNNPDIKISNNQFTITYSQKFEQPLIVEYDVACTETKFSRKGLDFYKCDSIHTSDNDDYANNEWDKGHMAPAADFACDEALLKGTFTYLNCTLQQEKLNRGVWRLLEAHERELAKKGKTHVKIQCHFSTKSKKLPSGATIPDGYTKTITCGTVKEIYYFPNTIPTKKTYNEYKK
jgi:endonuclease G